MYCLSTPPQFSVPFLPTAFRVAGRRSFENMVVGLVIDPTLQSAGGHWRNTEGSTGAFTRAPKPSGRTVKNGVLGINQEGDLATLGPRARMQRGNQALLVTRESKEVEP